MKSLLSAVVILIPSILSAFPLTDARNLALGGMAISSASQESSVFINPSVLGQAEGLRTSFTQTHLSVNDFDFGITASFPLLSKTLGVGFGWDALASRNQLLTGYVRDANGQYVIDPTTGRPQTQVLGFFTQNTNSFYLSLGAQFLSFSWGASLKYFLSDFGGTEGMGFGFDFAVREKLADGLYWSATLYDFRGSTIHFNNGNPDQVTPASLAASLSWAFLRYEDFTLMAEPGLSKDVWDDVNNHWGGGMEGSWRKSVFVRGGWNQGSLSLGVGLVAYPTKVFKEIRVDYSYLNNSPDGYPSRLTLSVAW